MTDPKQKFINRDLSWLEFNARVLEEAADKRNPLLERLKFIAIFSSNLDEFYMVRVAGVFQQLSENFKRVYEESGYVPAELMKQLDERARILVSRQYKLLGTEILPELEKNGLKIRKWNQLEKPLQDGLRKHFTSDILPVLTPIGIDQSHPFPLIQNLGLELLVRLVREGDSRDVYAVMEVPSVIPRFIEVEAEGHSHSFITAEELIANNLDQVFNKCEIKECSAFRITRDMDFSIDEESIADLLTEMQIALQKKAKRSIVRLEISENMTVASRKWLCDMLGVRKACVIVIRGIINLKSCFQLANPDLYPELCDEPLPPLPSIHLSPNRGIFETIREKGSFLVHHPYESFDPVVKFIEEAADDPNVLAIKQTLYRVSGNSPVVRALMKAARNGKQVSVLVELKARFDEANNINWAMELDKAGAHVVYGIAGLKVHCKALLVVRRESDGIRRYMHLGTGNYNDKTARLYTDLGFFTDDREFGFDVSSLFNVITGFSSPPEWHKLIVAPFTLRERLIYMIDREAKLSNAQNPGDITLKVNSLVDYEVMDHLYSAARRHVKIKLLVRGICGLNPFQLPPMYGKNIQVVSILDRYLEHARIYRFANNGNPEYYIGSADVMLRNLSKRIELLLPVENPSIREELDRILAYGLEDKRKGRCLTAPNRYSRTPGAEKYESTRSQVRLYQYYKARYDQFKAAESKNGALTVFTSPEQNNRNPSK